MVTQSKVWGASIFLAGLLSALSASAAMVDPTRPADFSGSADGLSSLAQDYQLNSVIIGDQRRVAIINGVRVREGDKVGAAQVEAIGKMNVKLLVQGKRISIDLNEDDFKQRK